MKKIRIFIYLIASISASFAQEKTGQAKKNSANAGIVFGANMGQFYRQNNERFRLPSKNILWNYQIGISNDALNSKFYKIRWELAFTRKGAIENFDNGINTKIAAKSDLAYGQFNLLPIVVTPYHYKSLSPMIGFGGYASYLVGGKINTSTNGSEYIRDKEGFNNLIKKDYGAIISLGLYFKKISLEYRQEIGIPQMIDKTKALSTIKNKTSSILLTFR